MMSVKAAATGVYFSNDLFKYSLVDSKGLTLGKEIYSFAWNQGTLIVKGLHQANSFREVLFGKETKNLKEKLIFLLKSNAVAYLPPLINMEIINLTDKSLSEPSRFHPYHIKITNYIGTVAIVATFASSLFFAYYYGDKNIKIQVGASLATFGIRILTHKYCSENFDNSVASMSEVLGNISWLFEENIDKKAVGVIRISYHALELVKPYLSVSMKIRIDDLIDNVLNRIRTQIGIDNFESLSETFNTFVLGI